MSDHPVSIWRFYRLGQHPKPKKHYYPAEFQNRRRARAFCRRRRETEIGLTIVHPNGHEERYVW